MNVIKFLKLVSSLLALTLLASACGSSQTAFARGGTLTLLTKADDLGHLDPQRNGILEQVAFASAYLNRTLTQYTLSDNSIEASQLVADLATDTGSTPDSGKTWVFTIRDGIKWEDGTAVTCEDLKYGVSRTFARSVITGGSSYAIELLDIPQDPEGFPIFKGPYLDDSAGKAAYDSAVICEGSKLTFRLKSPTPDFNYIVTLAAFAPVHKEFDTIDKYDDHPVSNGPYKIETYTKQDKLVLIRNENWDPASDSIRRALPDRIEYKFSVPKNVITERLMADAGADQFAISADTIDSTKLATVFADAKYEKRRWNGLDQNVRYFAINTTKVPNVKHRQAILAAVNREELRKLAGGNYAGEYADGVIKPNIGLDYAPTGLWDTLLGDKIPETGNPELAKKLIIESGETFPSPVTIDYQKNEVNDRIVGALVASLDSAGITAVANGIEPNNYYATVMTPTAQGSMSAVSWSSEWANASSVIPPLFQSTSSMALSRYSAEGWDSRISAARVMTDRQAQSKEWQAINSEAVSLGLVLPIRFGLVQRMAGSKVTGAYIWGPYSSLPYANLGVKSN